MNYRIRINKKKESAFLKMLSALEALGVILEYERLDKDSGGHKQNKAEEVADQYRDLVD
ncbi:MAG: hypothetical protein RIC19_15090 [Phaeodactylibacter sp.]|uniref:hypothetical protein n=1 Tax=Phaeodactylibacter sp. TaxID=1940289 RepID=UPI0032EF0D33